MNVKPVRHTLDGGNMAPRCPLQLEQFVKRCLYEFYADADIDDVGIQKYADQIISALSIIEMNRVEKSVKL